MLAYPEDLRRLVYTTNPIESLNASLRKVTKNKRVFPNDNAVFKQLFLAIRNKKSNWEKSFGQWRALEINLKFYLKKELKMHLNKKND